MLDNLCLAGEKMRKLFLIVLFVYAAAPMFAQTSGDITGEVRDPGAAVIVGATVTAKNSATNAIRSTTTNEAGVYNFPSLAPGTYDVTVRMQGFTTALLGGQQLQV